MVSSPDEAIRHLAALLYQLEPSARAEAMQNAVSFRPAEALEQSFGIGPLRAAFAECWEQRFAQPVPIAKLRAVLDRPIPIGTVVSFLPLNYFERVDELEDALNELLVFLISKVRELEAPEQLSLFPLPPSPSTTPIQTGSQVNDLQTLISQGRRYRTVYADPPWPYQNTASRAAAANHYPTISVHQICEEPVQQLVEEDAHLHLWTTNAFLREAFDVISAWGFQYKSALVWVKNELGMGNYWRVSHEYLLLGVRGSLPFQDQTQQSWIQASRTTHSRKPGAVRMLIERVSPGPYLELYGREQLPASAWTVYGNQIERRLF